jgi:diguanylate cyclase (GGDEF)-like protein
MPVSSTVSSQSRPAIHLTDVIDGILSLLARTLDVRLSMLTRIEGTTLTIAAAWDTLDLAQAGAVYPLENTFCLHMLPGGELSIADVSQASQPFQSGAYVQELEIKSFLGIPVVLDDGQVFGTLCVAESEPRAWSHEHRATMRLLARLLSHELLLDRAERQAERNRQFSGSIQSTDEITGLTSGPLFLKQLRTEAYRCIRYGGRYSVAIMELPDYDLIVKERGASVGTQLLQGFANTLMLNSRIVDCCARLEKSRFAVLFPETPAGNLPVWQQRVEAGLRTWTLLHPSLALHVHYSIGIADNEEAGDDRSVLHLATERMFANQVCST